MWLVSRGLHSPKDSLPCPSSFLQRTLRVSLLPDQGPVTSPQEVAHCPHSPPGVVGRRPFLGSGLTGPPWQRSPPLCGSGPALPMSLVLGCASTLAPMQLVGPGLELWLASGFSGARPAVAALGRAHSPCLASCSRSARTAVGQEALVASGPPVKLPPGLRPASPDPPQRGSLLVKQLVGQENPASGLPGTLQIEGPGDWLVGVGPSKGVLSSAPTPVGVGRNASASCRQQLAQTQAQAMRLPLPVHWWPLSALPASSWIKWPAGASGSCCPLQVTWQLSPSWETPVLVGGGRGPQTPRGQLHRCPGLQLHQGAGRLRLPFPAAPALPGENQVSPLGKTELAARDPRPCGGREGTCPASPGRLPRASDLLPGPRQGCSGIHTNQGGGGESGLFGPLPSAPVLSRQP